MKQTIPRRSLVVAIGVAVLGTAAPSIAFNFGDMMNPSRWMGGSRNHGNGNGNGYDDGPCGGPGYGYGAPGTVPVSVCPAIAATVALAMAPTAVPVTATVGPGGYGGPGYGYGGGYPSGHDAGTQGAYGAASPAPVPPATMTMPTYGTPSAGSTGGQYELQQLRQRVRELEGSGVR